MNKIGRWTEEVKVVRDNLKQFTYVTKDGEVVELHEDLLDELAMGTVNMAEELNNIDKPKLTDEQLEAMKYKKDQNELQIFIKDNCGSFYFNFYQRLLDKIEPQYLTRFLYLCTYLDYDGRLITKKSNRNICIKENELQFILKLSRTETYNTKVLLIENNLIEIKDDVIYINTKYCKKGEIMKNSRVEKVRMFDETIKELYESSSKTEHKKLALLFQILPYINLRWNVICKNPKEEILDEIVPYSLKELMGTLNQSNITRFKNSLLDLTVNGEEVVMINKKKNGELLTINPKVYYKGVNKKELQYLIGLFSIKIPISE